jgi:CRP-like cAMP-binding protein
MTWTNHFLETLAPADLATLEPLLSQTKLDRSQCVADAGEAIGMVYLPIDSILSVITVMRDGSSIESRTIGRESGFGLLHALGSRFSYERVEVQVGGWTWQVSTKALGQAADLSPTLRRSIVQHAQATMTPRMCRWLLMTRDRLGSDVLPLTQEHLGIMLGVQRTTVTAVAQDLQARRLISYVRGRIHILDVEGMRRCACECYARVEQAVDEILPRSDIVAV